MTRTEEVRRAAKTSAHIYRQRLDNIRVSKDGDIIIEPDISSDNDPLCQAMLTQTRALGGWQKIADCNKCALKSCNDDGTLWDNIRVALNANKTKELTDAIKAMIEKLDEIAETYEAPEDKEETHCRGDRFEDNEGYERILAQTGDNLIALISLSDGNRWEEPVKVVSPSKITNDEMNKITDEKDWRDKFTKIKTAK